MPLCSFLLWLLPQLVAPPTPHRRPNIHKITFRRTCNHTHKNTPTETRPCRVIFVLWGYVGKRRLGQCRVNFVSWGYGGKRHLGPCRGNLYHGVWGQATSRPMSWQLCIMGYGGKRHLGPCRGNFVSWGMGSSDI